MTKKSMAEIWAESEQGKHFCQCGCGEPITILPQHRYYGISKYIPKHFQRTVLASTEEDFWKKVNRTDGCWLWTGRWVNNQGYGMFGFHGRTWLVHRLSYKFTFGLDESLDVLHSCDTPLCVRPDHLFLGTHEDNMVDCTRKGRMHNKYPDDVILRLVELVRDGMPLRKAAEAMGISRRYAQSVIQGTTRFHLTGIPKTRKKRSKAKTTSP